jgi:hypothetical protein
MQVFFLQSRAVGSFSLRLLVVEFDGAGGTGKGDVPGIEGADAEGTEGFALMLFFIEIGDGDTLALYTPLGFR